MLALFKLIDTLWPILRPFILPVIVRQLSILAGEVKKDPELAARLDDWLFFWKPNMTFTEAQSAAKELQRIMRSV